MGYEKFRRELAIELSEPQLAKLKRIWATDKCPRRQYHRVIGDVDPLPVHFTSWKGSSVHRIIEKSLVGEEADINWEEFPDHVELIKSEAETHLSKFRKWMRETDVDMSEAEMEVKYEVEMPLGYVKVRKVDVVTPTHQIDWKTGKKRNTIDARIDLASGWDAAQKAGEGTYDTENLLLVFTGDPEPQELYPFRNKKTPFEQALEGMKKRDDENIFYREQIKAGEKPPCKVQFLCVFCPYRHVCRGV